MFWLTSIRSIHNYDYGRPCWKICMGHTGDSAPRKLKYNTEKINWMCQNIYKMISRNKLLIIFIFDNCAKHSPSELVRVPNNAKPGGPPLCVQKSLWPSDLGIKWTVWNKNGLLPIMIFDEDSDSGLNFSVGPRELLRHTPVLAHFGVHFDKNPIKWS